MRLVSSESQPLDTFDSNGTGRTSVACSLSQRIRDSKKEVGPLPACSRCLVEVPVGTALCPKCGAAIRPLVVSRPAPKRSSKSRQRLDALHRRDWVIGLATLVLLVSFWLPWYSLGPFSADGLAAHGWLFIAVVDSIVLLLYVVVTAFGWGELAVGGRWSNDQVLAVVTGVNLVLVVLAVLLADRLQPVVGRLPCSGRRGHRVLALWHPLHSGHTPPLTPRPFRGGSVSGHSLKTRRARAFWSSAGTPRRCRETARSGTAPRRSRCRRSRPRPGRPRQARAS